jgi:hypothetical protein
MEPASDLLSVVSFLDLEGFDHRGLIGQGDGSVAYTVAGGLRHLSAAGIGRNVASPEPGSVWRLARARRLDQVWAATERHAYRLAIDGSGVLQRIELSPQTVALASDDGVLGVLSVRELDERRARLRVDVYSESAAEVFTLRFDDPRPPASDASAPADFAPELRITGERRLVAVHGYGLSVWDYGAARRLLPPASR